MKLILLIASFLGFISVAFGAYAEHGLQSKIDSETFRFVMTAVRYNQIYAVLIAAISLSALTGSTPDTLITGLTIAAGIFVLGTVLFSFSIYLYAVFDLPALVKITPVGGVTLMIGWGALTWVAITRLFAS